MRFLIQKINDLKITQIKHGQFTDITDKLHGQEHGQNTDGADRNLMSEQSVSSPNESISSDMSVSSSLKSMSSKQSVLSPPKSAFLIYVGIEKGDEKKNLEEIGEYLENLQIIDENDKFSKTIKEVKPQLIFVSNITLVADFEKGRINFNQSLDKKLAKEIYEKFIEIFKNKGYQVFSTPFGSYLEITSTNLGPINFYLQV